MAGRQRRGVEIATDQSLLSTEGRNLKARSPAEQLHRGACTRDVRTEVSSQFKYIVTGITARRVGLKLAVSVFVIVQFAPGATAQTNQGTVIPPPRPSLSPVQLPDIRNMEPEVRNHITWAHDVLAAVVKDPTTPVEKLGEQYGVTGEIYHAYS